MVIDTDKSFKNDVERIEVIMKQLRGFLYKEEEIVKDNNMTKDNIVCNELLNVGANEIEGKIDFSVKDQ